MAGPAAVVHVDLDGARHIYAHHGLRYAGQRDRLFQNAAVGVHDCGVESLLGVDDGCAGLDGPEDEMNILW